jgi:Flp pilus assembly protein TadD
MLLPVSGVVAFGGHGYADRYTYLPLIGLFIAIVWGAAELGARSRRVRATVVAVGLAALCVLLGVARIQVGHWQTSETLFEHAVRVGPDNTLMHNKLGRVYSRQGRLEEAAEQYLRALELSPRYIQPRNSLGLIRLRQERLDEAIASFLAVLRLAPEDAPAHLNLAIALERQGRSREATRHRLRAFEIDPNLAGQSPGAEPPQPPVRVR